jgi:hypothetical protein
MGIPTITISEPWIGEQFNQFIQDIDQPAVVMFDEFEKVYNKRELQEGLLTLLDGVYPTQKLFILTVNDGYAVNDYMRNRPGRIFYSIEYEGLDEAFIKEYCEDCLERKDRIQSVLTYSKMFTRFNFDMLKALVEDMNRYDESAADVIKLLNAKPENDRNGGQNYDVTFRFNGIEVAEFQPTTLYGSPLARGFCIECPDPTHLKIGEDKKLHATVPEGIDKSEVFEEDGEVSYNWEVNFTPNDIVYMDKDGTYRYTSKDELGFEMVLTRKVEKARFDYTSLL